MKNNVWIYIAFFNAGRFIRENLHENFKAWKKILQINKIRNELKI